MVRYLVHRYPWLVLVRGTVAWELQVGPLILLWVHPEHRRSPFAGGRRLLIQRDPFCLSFLRRRLGRLGS